MSAHARIFFGIIFIVSIIALILFAMQHHELRHVEQFALTPEGTALLCNSSVFGRCNTNTKTMANQLPYLDTALQMSHADPGAMIERKYNNSQGDRYGIGQFPNGTMRIYAASDYGPSTINTSFANKDGTFADVMAVKKDGTIDMVSANGRTAKLCIDAQCITKEDIVKMKEQEAAERRAEYKL